MPSGSKIFGVFKRRLWSGPSPLLTNLALLLALLFVGMFLYTTLRRMFYPADLEWMEGALLTHVLEIDQHGHPYSAPSDRFIPFIYPPLYYYLLWCLSPITGVDYWVGRAVSLICTLAIAILLAKIVWRDCRRWQFAVIAAGLWLATYVVGATWFDLLRVDMLAFLFGFTAVYILDRRLINRRTAVIAAVLMVCACYTKQSLGLVAVAVGVFLAVYRRRYFWWYAGIGSLLGIAIFALLQSVTDGLFSWYVLVAPFQHGFRKGQAFSEQVSFIVARYPLGLFALGLALIPEIRRRADKKIWLWIAVAIVGLITAYIKWAHEGGFDNALISYYLWGTALFVVLAAKFAATASQSNKQGKIRNVGIQIGLLVVAVQMVSLLYKPNRWIPQPKDFRAADNIKAKIASITGRVLVPDHPYLLTQSGKPYCYHTFALMEVSRAKKGAGEGVIQTIADGKFDAIITAGGPLFPAMGGRYVRKTVLPNTYYPRTFTGAYKPIVGLFVLKPARAPSRPVGGGARRR